jgi:hypothetical protein
VLPLIAIGFPLAMRLIPAHVNETTESVDNAGGILSVVVVGTMILAINFAAVPDRHTLAIGLGIIAVAALVGFLIRQRRAANPLYDLDVAKRPIFWVAAIAGIIVFGSLMGALFIGQQFLQNVLDYSTVDAGLAILPAAAFMVLFAPRSAKLVESHGARFTLLCGYVFCLLAFAWMLAFWKEGISYFHVGIAYSFMGIGVGLAGTPASRSLTGAVPVRRAGMASGTADLQRDLGGAIMQSIFGALLTAGYASAFNDLIASNSQASSHVSTEVQGQLTKSFSSAANTAQQYPQYAPQIIKAAQQSFVDGQDWAYIAGITAVVLGMVIVYFLFPHRDRERELLDEYHREDNTPDAVAA